MFISSRFMRGIILASICLFYSTHSLSLARERSRSSVINNFVAARSLGSMLIREWISPIYRFFYSEKTQNQANNGYFQANLPCDREHIEIFADSSIGRYFIKRMVKNYPVVRQQIASCIISNIDRLIKSDGGIFLIKAIIESDPSAGQWIAKWTISNIEKLIDSWNGSSLINAIIENDPSTRRQIIQYIVSNFDRLIESLEGIVLIGDIIEKNPSARQQIISYIINNFDRLIESLNGRCLIEHIIKSDSSVRGQIIQYIVSNFERLIKSDGGRLLVKVIIEKYPDAREQIISDVVSNVDRLIESLDGRFLIREIIEKYPDAREQITPCIIKNVARLIESYSGTLLIKVIIENDPSARQYIKENYKKKKITKLPLLLFSYFCEKFPQDKCLRDRLKEESHEYGIEGIIKRILYLKSCPEGKNDRLKSSLPTVKHIERYRKSITKLIEEYSFSSNFSSMLDRAFRKEVELEKSGYVAFKHGQRWGHGLPEKWFTTLWAITKEKSITDFIFLHVKSLLKNDNLAGEIEMKKRLLTSGSSSDDDWQHLLFMNYALFGNTGFNLASSIFYAANNKNAGSRNISLKNVFNYLGHEDIYKKYEKQLQELEQEYKGLSNYGSMVVIGVPEDKLADSVYLATGSGQKVKMDIEGIGETDDIKTIITTLRHAPEKIKDSDKMEFALIMTQDKHGGLNPESGIKVHMFDAADPEKLAVFREKESLLLEQIKQEIEQEKSKESAETTAGQFIRSAL